MINTYLGGELPVILCIGSDLVIGDCLAPLVGSMLRENGYHGFIYGTLEHTVTAKELPYVRSYIRKINPNQKLLVIDAAIGTEEEVGTIQIRKGNLYPGSGINKNFEPIGDVSILGIVSKRSIAGYSINDLTHLKLVNSMAKTISHSICLALNLRNYEKMVI